MYKRKANGDFVEKHKMRVINDYKKFKRQQGRFNPDNTTGKKNFEKNDNAVKGNKSNKDPLSFEVAYQKGIKVKEEKEQIALQRKKGEKNRNIKLRKRKQVHNKLSAKTATGQPVMKNHIQFLLNKIESNKELYCLNSKQQ